MSNSPATTAPNSLHQEDDIQVGTIVFWGIITVVITIASVFGLHGLANWYIDQRLPDTLYGPMNVQAEDTISKQEGLLVAPPAWVDKEKGVVSIPLERAEAITLEEFKTE